MTTASTSQIPNHDDATKHIYDVANDVEMQDAFPTQNNYVIIDTNVLIDHLDVIQQFSDDIESLSLPVLILIPNVVISELDGCNDHTEGLAWSANRASSWVLDKITNPRSVKVQARNETESLPTSNADKMRMNDLSIVGCCMHFQKQGNIALLTRDKNLFIECKTHHLFTIYPPARGQRWSSRELARHLWPPGQMDLTRFAAHTKRYSKTHERTAGAARHEHKATVQRAEDDVMEIDDGDSQLTSFAEEKYELMNPINALHVQIVEHFRVVVYRTAERVRRESGYRTPPSQSLSLHAPGVMRKPSKDWTMSDCMDYLGTKKKLVKAKECDRAFWCLRQDGEHSGWRNGDQWATSQWMKSLDALKEIGEQFEDGWLLNSLETLAPEVHNILYAPRPAGM
ncbi:hypothetical protein OBBRIDRAFT_725934 [Obba rivulosa]|uniref:PIN domain-containing protein n=1 Tax=Obba rivulosa TaxID=1052685 RepID=A0A8E2AXI3_9APHY|nr:hypothetical protein OBBRIDRAFT_725934 [Obba rivulosa]